MTEVPWVEARRCSECQPGITLRWYPSVRIARSPAALGWALESLDLHILAM